MYNSLQGYLDGVFNISCSLTFYPGREPLHTPDVVLPITPNTSGYASFAIYTNSTSLYNRRFFNLPRNIYRAQIDVLQQPTGGDEFYWENFDDKYANALPDEVKKQVANGGVFREVQAHVDGNLVGTVWQHPVIYTGGLDPLFWEPVVSNGDFISPTYTLEITPFVSRLVDGKPHKFSLAVNPIRGGWYTSGVLLLWLDKNSKQTKGEVVQSQILPRYITPSVSVDFAEGFPNTTFDATMTTQADRTFTISGTVITSFGKFTSTVKSSQTLYNQRWIFKNLFNDDVIQRIQNHVDVHMADAEGNNLYSHSETYVFPFTVYNVYTPFDPEYNNYNNSGFYDQAFNFYTRTQYRKEPVRLENQTNHRAGAGFYNTETNDYALSSSGEYFYANSFGTCFQQAFAQQDFDFLFNRVDTSCPK